MRLLALDVGMRHTGVAFFDEDTGVPVPLDTIHHDSVRELMTSVEQIVKERSIDHIVVGLPLLPSGKEGAQAQFVRTVTECLSERAIPFSLLDERYTTPRDATSDRNASAACSLLSLWLKNSI